MTSLKILYLLVVFAIIFYTINYKVLVRISELFFIGRNKPLYGILIGVAIAGVYYFSNTREGFEWSSESTDEFVKFQKSIHPNISFDTNEIQKQASQEEVDYFLNNGMWPWSQEVQDLYKSAVETNPFIRVDSDGSIDKARKIYNQSIVLEMLSWKTKEGQFLINGVALNDASGNPQGEFPSGFGEYGYNSGLIDKMNNVIRCKTDENGNSSMVKITKSGETPFDYDQLDLTIPGFSFIREKCNPCVAVNSMPDYSCPFNLDIPGKRHGVSRIWQYLWGIDTNPMRLTPASIPEVSNPNEFPLLSGLKQELVNLSDR